LPLQTVVENVQPAAFGGANRCAAIAEPAHFTAPTLPVPADTAETLLKRLGVHDPLLLLSFAPTRQCTQTCWDVLDATSPSKPALDEHTAQDPDRPLEP
jgi:hypothetical protein